MATDLNNEENFAALVLELNNRNPTWTPAHIATEVESYEKKPNLERKSLRWKINKILKRKTIKKRIGNRKKTVRTETYKIKVKKLIKLKVDTSQRIVNEKLKKKGFKSSKGSVYNTIKELNLKPFKRVTTQDLTPENKLKRVECAKKLRTKFGTRKDRKWKWNCVINTDFSGIFTLKPFHNKKNDVIYAKNKAEIPANLRTAPKQKFAKGVVFWGAISSFGLIPKNGPINFTKWLNDQRPRGSRRRMYMTGALYAEFLHTKAIPVVKKVVGNKINEVFWQDDQDGKHRVQEVINLINEEFEQRVDPEDGDAKLADVWPIENLWGMLKEKIRGVQFKTEQSLLNRINKEWKSITILQCQQMIDRIPNRLSQVIEKNGEQI